MKNSVYQDLELKMKRYERDLNIFECVGNSFLIEPSKKCIL